MGGAGRKTVDGNALTERKTVRRVTSADASVDDVAEIIDTKVDDNGQPVANGHGATLAVFVILDGASSVSVSLWYFGNDEEEEGGSSSSPSGDEGDWCKYAEETGITDNKMLVYPNVVAGEWKVVVDAADGGTIIREAHSA